MKKEILKLTKETIKNRNTKLNYLLSNSIRLAERKGVFLKNLKELYINTEEKDRKALETILEPFKDEIDNYILEIQKDNIVSLINDNIENMGKYPIFNNKDFSYIIKGLDLSKEDFDKMIVNHQKENLGKIIEKSLKDNGKYPNYKSKEVLFLKNSLNYTEDEYLKLITDIILGQLEKDIKSKTKIKYYFAKSFLDNKELFMKFLLINQLEYKKIKEFQDIGKKVNNILLDAEDSILQRMEGGQFGDMSVSVKDKFRNHVRKFFPLVEKVGVKTRKLSKKEMEEYIRKNS